MNTTDPIADMLTRIRNANRNKFKTVDVPASNMKIAIAQNLLDEGYKILHLLYSLVLYFCSLAHFTFNDFLAIIFLLSSIYLVFKRHS